MACVARRERVAVSARARRTAARSRTVRTVCTPPSRAVAPRLRLIGAFDFPAHPCAKGGGSRLYCLLMLRIHTVSSVHSLCAGQPSLSGAYWLLGYLLLLEHSTPCVPVCGRPPVACGGFGGLARRACQYGVFVVPAVRVCKQGRRGCFLWLVMNDLGQHTQGKYVHGRVTFVFLPHQQPWRQTRANLCLTHTRRAPQGRRQTRHPLRSSPPRQAPVQQAGALQSSRRRVP